MSAAEKRGELIAAMYAISGERYGAATDWLERACLYPQLRDALRACFGKRMPTHQKLGQWLSERQGEHFGDHVLQGKHSPKRKAWLWRVASLSRIAELEAAQRAAIEAAERQRQAALQEAQQRAREILEERAARKLVTEIVKFETAAGEAVSFRRTRAAPAPVQAPAPKPEQFEYETQRFTGDGTPLPRKMMIDPRTGEPVRVHPVQTEAPKLEPKPAPKPAPAPPAPARVPRICEGGKWRAMTAEEIEQHAPRVENAGFRFISTENVATGFADPGGIVGDNISKEQSHESHVYVTGRWIR